MELWEIAIVVAAAVAGIIAGWFIGIAIYRKKHQDAKAKIENADNEAIGIINNFIGKLDGVKIPTWVPGVGGKTFSMPKIPFLEEGGVLEKGQVGFLEGNGAEAVVPLHQNKQWVSAVARDMDSAIGGGTSSQIVALLQDILEVLEAIAGAGAGLDTTTMVRALVDVMAKPMDKKLGQLQAAKARA